MNIKLLFPILIVFAAGFVMLLIAAKKGKGQTGTYRRRKLMTDNEEEFSVDSWLRCPTIMFFHRSPCRPCCSQ